MARPLPLTDDREGRTEETMLRWALVFFVLALVAAFIGFGGIAEGAATVGKILCAGFLVLTAVAIGANRLRARKGT